MAGLINPKTKQWIGEDAILVQAGDGTVLIMPFTLAFVAAES